MDELILVGTTYVNPRHVACIAQCSDQPDAVWEIRLAMPNGIYMASDEDARPLLCAMNEDYREKNAKVLEEKKRREQHLAFMNLPLWETELGLSARGIDKLAARGIKTLNDAKTWSLKRLEEAGFGSTIRAELSRYLGQIGESLAKDEPEPAKTGTALASSIV